MNLSRIASLMLLHNGMLILRLQQLLLLLLMDLIGHQMAAPSILLLLLLLRMRMRTRNTLLQVFLTRFCSCIGVGGTITCPFAG